MPIIKRAPPKVVVTGTAPNQTVQITVRVGGTTIVMAEKNLSS